MQVYYKNCLCKDVADAWKFDNLEDAKHVIWYKEWKQKNNCEAFYIEI